MRTVRKAMGSIQLQFIEVNGPSYRYTQSNKWFKFHAKWKAHRPFFRGRQHVVVLTREVPAESKSGSSYDILGVFCILNNEGELSSLNAEYWNLLRSVNTDEEKQEVTIRFMQRVMEALDDAGRTNNYYIDTYSMISPLETEDEDNKPVPFAIL